MILPSLLLAFAPAAPDLAVRNVRLELVRQGGLDAPGCTLAASLGGQQVLQVAHGMATLAPPQPLHADSVLNAASVSKQFTAALILSLVEEGRLALGDPVHRFIPQLPDYGTPITVRHLLEHSSGLRDYTVLSEIAGWPNPPAANTNAEVVAMLARQRGLNHRPGQNFRYNNSGYVLLAVIAERVTGLHFGELLQRRLFHPLEMMRTRVAADTRSPVSVRPAAYALSNGAWQTDPAPPQTYGSSNIVTTAPDLERWNRALNRGFPSAFVVSELQRPVRLRDGRTVDRGRGLYLRSTPFGREISHAGGSGSFRAWTMRYPARGLSVSALCNHPNGLAEDIARIAAAPFLPAAHAVEAIRPQATIRDLQPGSFLIPSTGLVIEVAASGDSLTVGGKPLARSAPNLLAARRWAGDGLTIAITGPDSLVVSDPAGDAPLPARAWRLAPITYDEQALRAFEGWFASAEARGGHWVKLVGGKLFMLRSLQPAKGWELKEVGRDRFRIPGGLATFRRGRNGKIEAFDLSVPRIKDLRFAKSK